MVWVSVAFVWIWSTGFLVGRAIVPVAGPSLFLTARFLLAGAMFLAIALAARVPWPSLRELPRHLAVGVLLNGVYLVGGYWAVAQGLSPAIMALLGALQPLFTTLLAMPLLGEYPEPRFWWGLAAGMGGVGFVLAPALQASGSGAVPPWAVGVGLLSVLSLTMGTLLQKTSIASADIRATSALQNFGAALFAGVAALGLKETRWAPGPVLYASLGWGGLMLSGVGTFLLLWLVRRGQVARVASLMYLAPPLAALGAYLLFGNRLSPMQIGGFVLALLGVMLCNLKRQSGNDEQARGHRSTGRAARLRG